MLDRFTYTLVDKTSWTETAPLDTVENGGTITWSATELRQSGTLPCGDLRGVPNDAIIRVKRERDTLETVGTFRASFSKYTIMGSGRWDGELNLTSMLSYLQNDAPEAPVTVPAGTVVTDYVIAALGELGLQASIPQVSVSLTDARSYVSETWLEIMNDLLNVAGMEELDVDPDGFITSRIYQPPSQRGITAVLDSREDSRFVGEIQHQVDNVELPNGVRLNYSGAEGGLYATAIDEDSALGLNARGFHALVVEDATDIQGEDIPAMQNALQEKADQRLAELQQSSASSVFSMEWRPDVKRGDVIRVVWYGIGAEELTLFDDFTEVIIEQKLTLDRGSECETTTAAIDWEE